MIPGFHCSSLEFHDAVDLIPILAEMGFGAIAISPKRGSWDIDLAWFETRTAEIAGLCKEHEVRIVVDLDAPFFDRPVSCDCFGLASGDADEQRLASDKVLRWIDATAEMSPLAITFSSGRGCGQSERTLERLTAAVQPLAERAAAVGTHLALRPVTEHAIATVAHFERFGQWIGGDTSLRLAADVGEMVVGGEFPIGARLARMQHRLSCVYLCEPDLECGGDLPFGRGDIDMGRVWQVMTQSGFTGPVIFRAFGQGRRGLDLARQAITVVNDHRG
ncbi:sugar phosphate isomerase/epimerase family protein [Roseiconus lacunae]|uniref:TIM barrel protein n=1 Tax=Roseiconus lacunae TaxID=2605694 RepID=A0ABT7PFX0_9BACT|nr:TIM barrel protein [Roseiconus lacunae]MDM4015377.1 TIM barrel protein [Roseiconus lacunae]WRQ52946.1 TIM barrel protein [Stieleria sp. HD01]